MSEEEIIVFYLEVGFWFWFELRGDVKNDRIFKGWDMFF